MRNGQRQYHSFFPIGPDIAWYGFYMSYNQPFGIYDYERYIDSLSGNGNYMRVFLNRYRSLNLYGPEYTEIENNHPKVYFDSIINQKDAAELDHIITYASQHDISIMLSFLSYNDLTFSNSLESTDPWIWANNPYHTILGLGSPHYYYADPEARRITRNLFRYILSRWGYATNIMCWEFWNEVNNACSDYKRFEEEVLDWHEDMLALTRAIDPFDHCISTSMGSVKRNPVLYAELFENLDIVQQHNYQNINKAKSKEQFSYILYDLGKNGHDDYLEKPFFMGEFGFGLGRDTLATYYHKDPWGVDLHNSIWSSLFSTSMGPASFWWWNYMDNNHLFGLYHPLLVFCNNLPILSDSFEANTTGRDSLHMLLFDNNIETYYMYNTSEDTILGWCQDTAYAYQSLRWLTDSVRMVTDSTGEKLHFVSNGVLDSLGYVYTKDPNKKPDASSSSNLIKIPVSTKAVGTHYQLRWFNAETGLWIANAGVLGATVHQEADGKKYIYIYFPYTIRDVSNHTIYNTFGDAVFTLYCDPNPRRFFKER